ncbi:P-loop containing nucleoside triphosphate hydrolase protein [Gloeopeniophorella convolvens]|nr:P-loop containing nucleoside triphosphate hydrolase protein [Gloeopeniophorella convolvens]
MSNAHKIKIIARLRPPIPGELSDDGIRIVEADDGLSAICVNNPRDISQVFKFPFSSCYGHESLQEDIFETDVRPLIDVVYSGATVTVFAYGVTSSGKTHTMQGTRTQPGVIPRSVEALFNYKERITDHEVTLSVSYMEIYKDEVYDLLVDRETAPKLPVRENDVGQVFVANLSSMPVDDIDEFLRIYTIANKKRSVGSTLLNRASSRSHAILTLQARLTQGTKVLTGKMNLVDLAGSENNKMTGNDQSRLQESAAINKSLSVLGQVVHALNQGASRIPYRNSKLTRILQDALGGSSVGLLICNLAPGIKFRQDTLNTLNFASRTKNVENKPVINEQDSRPTPKPHFAAVQQAPPKMALLAMAPPVAGPSRPRPSVVGTRGAAAGAVGATRPSRMPRISAAFQIAESIPHIIGKRKEAAGGASRERPNTNKVAFTDQDLDDRISKAVEAEVERRLKEKLVELERQRQADEADRGRRDAETTVVLRDQSLEVSQRSLPPGLLTPLLKRHEDLDNELRRRLQELERKYERGRQDGEFVRSLSPTSRKKTGRAYVALARAHSEKGDLQVALDLYRKAETYVPDNMKLKERIMDIKWAVANGIALQPSPKRPKRTKSKKKARQATQARTLGTTLDTISEGGGNGEESHDDETVEVLLEDETVTNFLPADLATKPVFGVELTNSPHKRGFVDDTNGDAPLSPPRKLRREVVDAADGEVSN